MCLFVTRGFYTEEHQNKTDTPRLLTTIRYVRNWYADNSREVNSIPTSLWESLTADQRQLLRFPIQANK